MSISSQSSSSSLHKTIHLDQISTIHVQSCTTLPSKTPSKTPYCDKALSIEALRVLIFTFLPPLAAVNACHLDRAWNHLENNIPLWRAKFSQDVRDTFAPLVKKNLVTWPKVALYTRLSFFVTSIIEDKHSCGEFILLKNPKMYNPSINPIIYMPRPFAQSGNCRFAIYNCTDIEVQEEGKPDPFFLKGETGKMLTHLAVEGKHVFALVENGEIFHWDDKIRKENISTVYSTRTEDFKRKGTPFSRISRNRFCDKFYIKNEIIIMTYEREDERTPVKLLEIIPFKDPTKRQLIKNFPLVLNLTFIEVLEDQIIILGRDFNFQNSIWKMTLPKPKTDTLLTTSPLIWTTSFQNTLEAMTRQYSIKDIKLDCDPISKNMDTCIVIQNLVFSFSFWVGRIFIDVMRVNAENVNYVYRYRDGSEVPLRVFNSQWRTDMLTRLFLIAQREFGWCVPQVAATPEVAVAPGSDSSGHPEPELQFEPKPKPKLSLQVVV